MGPARRRAKKSQRGVEEDNGNVGKRSEFPNGLKPIGPTIKAGEFGPGSRYFRDAFPKRKSGFPDRPRVGNGKRHGPYGRIRKGSVRMERSAT